MRKTTIGILAVSILAVSILAVSGCGNGAAFANRPRPPAPVNLTVYINNARVSVSPSSVGAGPVVFIVTNQASKAETMSIEPAGSSKSLVNTGPINPQATTQVQVDFSPGDYTVSTGTTSGTDAALAVAPAIQPASLHIGPERPSASNALLQP